MLWKNWTIAKPNPISETAVRMYAIIVRSTASRVRSQRKMAFGGHANLEAIGLGR